MFNGANPRLEGCLGPSWVAVHANQGNYRCTYMFVYIYIYTYTYVFTYIYIHYMIYIYIYLYIYIHILFRFIYSFVYIFIYMYIYISIYLACLDIPLSASLLLSLSFLYLFRCLCICLSIIYLFCICICMHVTICSVCVRGRPLFCKTLHGRSLRWLQAMPVKPGPWFTATSSTATREGEGGGAVLHGGGAGCKSDPYLCVHRYIHYLCMYYTYIQHACLLICLHSLVICLS